MNQGFPSLPFWPSGSTARRTGGVWLLALVFATGLVVAAGAVVVGAGALLALGLLLQCGALALVVPLGLRSLAAIRDRSRLSIALKGFTSVVRDATSEMELSATIGRTVMATEGMTECNILLPREGDSGLRIALSLGRQPGDRPMSAILESPRLCPVMNTSHPHMVVSVRARGSCDCPLGVPARGGHACLPLVSHGRAFGLVNVQSASPRGLSQAHVQDHLEAIGFIGSLAMADQQALTRMQQQAMTDVQTGLYNRRFLEASLTHVLAVAGRNSTTFTVLMMDLDHFKQFNDTHGHAAGDALLAAFGNQLKPIMRDGDILARYGGEEFVAVLPATTDAQAEELGDRLRREVWDLVVPGLEHLAAPVATLSMGLASFPRDAGTVEDLLKVADRALYQAKEAGRDRIQRLSAEPVPA